MEENNFLIASAIAVVFAITKFIEKRFVLKDENLVLKDLLRDLGTFRNDYNSFLAGAVNTHVELSFS